MIANINPMAANTNKAGFEITLCDIDAQALLFANARAVLAERVQKLNDEIEAVKRRLLPGIKTALAATAREQVLLQSLIEASPALFTSPRTVVFHGIKVGFRKGSGGIEFDDADTVVKLIKKHLASQAEVLIKTKETPNKKALEGLEVSDLKRIGCTVEATSDVVVIRPIDSEVDKIVAALLKDATEEAEVKAA